MAARTLIDRFADSFADAVSDIRQKLLDEAWFGRSTVQPDRSISPSPAGVDQELGWTSAERAAAPAARPVSRWDEICAERAKSQVQEPERDIDHERDR